MKKVPTTFLKVLLAIIAGVTFIASVSVGFVLSRSQNSELVPNFIVTVLAVVAFLYALYEAIKLLNYVDADKVFSEAAVKALKHIKYSALVVSGLYILLMPYLYFIAQGKDAPGIIAICCICAGSAFVVATFVAVLQRVIQNAVELKSENDLTV